jgi:hypothetical protein
MVENYGTEKYDKFIITYNGSKEEFNQKYYDKLVNDKCSILTYIKAEDKTIAILNCYKNHSIFLDDVVRSFNDEKIVFEKEQKVKIIK